MRSRAALLLVGALSRLAAAREPPPPSFDPAKAAPYFERGPAAAAIARFHVEDWRGTAERFDAYLKKNPRAPDREPARFVAALALSRLGKFEEAARRFDALEKSYPLLADHHRVHAARAYLAAKKFAEALDRAERVEKGSPLEAEARFARAQALAGLGRSDEAAAAFRRYLDEFPRSFRQGDAQVQLAEAKEALSAWPEARSLYRDLYVHQPADPAGRRAEGRLRERDPPALNLDGPELLARGLALFDAQRNAESEAELRAALARGGLDGKQRCAAAYNLAQSVFKERDRPRAAPLFDAALEACEKLTDDASLDLHMKALYQGGRCHAAKNEPEKALALFQRAEQAHPSHSYADDARLRAAEMYDALAARARAADGGVAAGDALSQQGLKLLANLADKFPSGDVRSEALFRVFFAAWKAGNLDEAARALDTSLAKVPREEGWWDAGRTLYWIGRVADKQGRAADARAAWSRCAREYPLSYYALAALNRLREQSPDEAAKLCAALERPPPTAKDLAWRFAPRPLFGEPAFLRGVELARLGLGADAKRELAAAGIHAPEKGAKVDPSGEELLWLATVLYDRAGDWALSHWIPRHTLTDYSRTWPTGENRKRWLLSYPRGYAELIGPNARKCGQPEALEFAIVREESAFDPLTESFANAVGLTQLTQAPAKRFAEGLPYSREALRDPAINVAIGARELGELWQRYSGGAAFVIAGYNAGEHRVQQWLRAAPPGQPLDEWIESIPFDETRGYTKRVLSSWFAYHWLYRGASADPLPPLPNTLPKR